MIFNINSDTDRKMSSRILWLIDNFIDNLNPSMPTKSDIKILPFNNKDNSFLMGMDGFDTPSRCMSNIFWSSIDWQYIKNAFDGSVSVLDIGCGSGKYSNFFPRVSNDIVSRYHGIDIIEHADWSGRYARENFSFSVDDIDNIKKIYNDENLILSQSVLEHVEHDKKLINDVSDIAKKQKKRIIQIHLVPSSVCLYQYLWHGYRQYTPKKLDHLLKNVINANKYLIPLGGLNSNAVHIQWITIPLIISKLLRLRVKSIKNSNHMYTEKRNKAILLDSEKKLNINKASFYAIIVDHNFDDQGKNYFI